MAILSTITAKLVNYINNSLISFNNYFISIMPEEKKVFEGKFTWGMFETAKKSNTHSFFYSWDAKKTTIKSVKLKAEFWWENAVLCGGHYAHVYFNDSFVDKIEWWTTCDYHLFEKSVNLNNGNNTVKVEVFAGTILTGIASVYRITITINYEGEKPIDITIPPIEWLIIGILGFVAFILLILIRRKRRRKE